jgi:hypothetical protein
MSWFLKKATATATTQECKNKQNIVLAQTQFGLTIKITSSFYDALKVGEI